MLREDDLQLKGLKLLQDDELFSFGIDAVLLADFVKCKKTDRVLDLGTGNGILPILLYGKEKSKDITGVEIQKRSKDLATHNVEINKLEDSIQIIGEDLRKYHSTSLFDVIVTNPPYQLESSGEFKREVEKAIARTELKCKLEDIFETIRRNIKIKGHIFMVHRPNRLVDIFSLARTYDCEPKRLRFVKPYLTSVANLVLIEMVRGANPFLKIEEDLVIYEKNGDYTQEVYKIYGMKR